jgi:hypothetical protein
MTILGTAAARGYQDVVKRRGIRSAVDPYAVIPAKAGIHFALALKSKWIPAFAGMTA